jgi:hypothetical protein
MPVAFGENAGPLMSFGVQVLVKALLDSREGFKNKALTEVLETVFMCFPAMCFLAMLLCCTACWCNKLPCRLACGAFVGLVSDESAVIGFSPLRLDETCSGCWRDSPVPPRQYAHRLASVMSHGQVSER